MLFSKNAHENAGATIATNAYSERKIAEAKKDEKRIQDTFTPERSKHAL